MAFQLPEKVVIDRHISGYAIRGYKEQHVLDAYEQGKRDAQKKQNTVGYITRTGGGTFFKESISDELASLKHGDRPVWEPVFSGECRD